MWATLEHVLTDDAFEHMTGLATWFTEGVQAVLDLPPGALVGGAAGGEGRVAGSVPGPGQRRPVGVAGDDELDDYLHVYLHNWGILLTPFHNMALMCPATTTADVDRHTEVFGAAVAELVTDGG